MALPSRFILASGSPRRRQLLGELGVGFEIIKSDTEETKAAEEPIQLVTRLAMEKALAVASSLEGPQKETVVLGCDTVVVLDGEIMGKPKDMQEAFAMLQKLQGRVHTVYSGLGLVRLMQDRKETISSFAATEVAICRLTRPEMERYFELENPLDKAGAYAIQGAGSLIVSNIEGCYYNVMGLPIRSLENLLRQWGYSLFTPRP